MPTRRPRAKSLGSDLDRYVTTSWLRDREAGLPIGQSERRVLQYQICAPEPDRTPPVGYVRLLEIITAAD